MKTAVILKWSFCDSLVGKV